MEYTVEKEMYDEIVKLQSQEGYKYFLRYLDSQIKGIESDILETDS